MEVDFDHAAPVLGRQLVEFHGLEDPGVADHRIETTEPVDRGAHDRLPALRIGHGIVRCHRNSARALDLQGHLIGDARVRALAVHRASDVVHHDRRTEARKLHRVESTETSSRSRDDHDLVIEVDHARAARLGSSER